MKYRVIYDVLDDGLRWGAPTLLSVTLLFCAFAFSMSRRQWRGMGMPRQSTTVASRLFILALVVGGLAFAGLQSLMFRQQQRCKAWAHAGQYIVVEGTVSNYERSRNILRFSVADTTFSCANRFGGYWGEFTAPGASQDALRNGLRVRINHREGYILRIEIVAEQGAAADAGQKRRRG